MGHFFSLGLPKHGFAREAFKSLNDAPAEKALDFGPGIVDEHFRFWIFIGILKIDKTLKDVMDVEAIRAVLPLEIFKKSRQIESQPLEDEKEIHEVSFGSPRRDCVDLHAADVEEGGDPHVPYLYRFFEERIRIMEKAYLRSAKSPDEGICLRVVEHKPALAAQGILNWEKAEFSRSEEIEVMGETMFELKSAARSSRHIKRSQEFLSRKNFQRFLCAGSKDVIEHQLLCQHHLPVLGALLRNIPASLKGLSNVTPGINGKKPYHGFLISQL